MRHLKRVSSALVAVFLGLWTVVPPSSAGAESGPPGISAEAAALIDVTSGRILYEKQGDKKMRIASLTKTMTAIVAIDSGHLQDVVTVPPEAVGVEGSSIYLKKGERLTLEDLLYGLMLRSGNDAAVAIATHVGGSVPGFVYLMNEKAAMIGMTNTHFTNPHGLDDSNMHYSTARDMAILSAYALNNPIFRQIVSTKVKKIAWEGEPWERRLVNKNKLLSLYKGADGVKTGYTRLARRCLASSATRDGRQLAAVVLNAPNDWADSMALLDWGFHTFQPVKVVGKGDAVDPELTLTKRDENLVLTAAQDFVYPLAEHEVSQITSRVMLFDRRLDRSMIGRHVGFLQVYLGSRLVGKVPLTVQEAVPSSAGHAPVGADGSFWTLVWRIMAGGIWDA